MPMLYVIQHGGNFVPEATKAENIVYVVCSVIKIHNLGYNFYFSDGHATDILTTFYDKSKIDDINTILDWSAIKSPYWGGENNLDIKRKKQAEFLIGKDVSPDTIIGFGCYNDKAKKKLAKLGINKDLIKIIPNAYY